MMTMAEIQLVTYLQAVLQQRGYTDVAQMLNDIVDAQCEPQTEKLAPVISLRPTG